jgi:hypothetical protein
VLGEECRVLFEESIAKQYLSDNVHKNGRNTRLVTSSDRILVDRLANVEDTIESALDHIDLEGVSIY